MTIFSFPELFQFSSKYFGFPEIGPQQIGPLVSEPKNEGPNKLGLANWARHIGPLAIWPPANWTQIKDFLTNFTFVWFLC